MNYSVIVKYKYMFANPYKETLRVSELLNSIEHIKEKYLENWIESDEIYDPLNYYKVTKFNLNNKGQANFIELTEMGNKFNE